MLCWVLIVLWCDLGACIGLVALRGVEEMEMIPMLMYEQFL
jgi:hypothetical protein